MEEQKVYYGTPQAPDYFTKVQESIDATGAAVDTARELVINRRNAESKFKKELYGEGLGNMYDGDREAAEKMRQYIEYQYEQGLYNSDPTKFSKIVADYNAHVELFQQHYKNTYGTSESDGSGTTYTDVQMRQAQNASDSHWASTGNRIVGNEFDQAQTTLGELNQSLVGLDFDEEKGSFVAIDPTTGEKVAVASMSQYQLGQKAFIPELEKLEPPTFLEASGSSEVGAQVALRMRTVKADGSAVTAAEAAGLVFDDKIGINLTPGSQPTKSQSEYRELVAVNLSKELGLELSEQEVEAFATGNLDAHPDRMEDFAAMLKMARERFIDINRFGVSTGSQSGSGKKKEAKSPLSGSSRDFSVSAGGVPIDQNNVRLDNASINVVGMELDKPIKQDQAGPTGEYTVTHIMVGPRGEKMVKITVPTPMVMDIETGVMRPPTENDPSSDIQEVDVPYIVDIQGTDPRSMEILRNLQAVGIDVNNEIWTNLFRDTRARIDADNEAILRELNVSERVMDAMDVEPTNIVSSVPLDTQPSSQEEQSEERGLGRRLLDAIRSPFSGLNIGN